MDNKDGMRNDTNQNAKNRAPDDMNMMTEEEKKKKLEEDAKKRQQGNPNTSQNK